MIQVDLNVDATLNLLCANSSTPDLGSFSVGQNIQDADLVRSDYDVTNIDDHFRYDKSIFN